MPSGSHQTTSAWMLTPAPKFPTLQADMRTEVCVIGAGIAGLTTAYLLTGAGKSVIVIDDGPIGSGETGRTTAHLTAALDDRYLELERIHGGTGARLAAASHTTAIDRIEAIVSREGIECDFERLDGYLFAAPETPKDMLEHESAAAQRAGLSEVRLLPRAPLPFFDTGACLQFPRQAQFHPLKYLTGLTRSIRAGGGSIFTETHATEIAGGDAAYVTTTSGATIHAETVVVATNTPINDRVILHTKQAPYRTYVIGVSVPHGSIPKGLFWDTADPYHYMRVAGAHEPTDDLLIVGGEDHKTGQADDTEERFTRLEAWTRVRFPMALQVAYRWSGQVMEPVDGLAFIGRNAMDAPNIYIATGDSGNGMTHGTIAGILLTDLIVGRDNPWATLYDPSRKSLRALKELTRENLNVALQYTAWMTAGEVDTAEAIPPGTGAIMRRGLKKVAVYRDEADTVHVYTAECPHLGCIVRWNSAERSWDCPCHGSRFDPYGHVINGPANVDLAPVAPEA